MILTPSMVYKFAPGVDALDAPVSAPASVDTKRMSAKGLLATEARDRQGDILEVAGLETTDHERNPVVLLDHGKYHALPIGVTRTPEGVYTVEVDPIAGQVWQTTYFSQKSQVAEQVFALIAEGILRGNSIGFRMVENDPLPQDPENGFFRNKDGMAGKLIRRSELVECSWCGVPVNPEAARAAVGKAWCGKSLCEPITSAFQAWIPERKAQVVGGWDSSLEADMIDLHRTMNGLVEKSAGLTSHSERGWLYQAIQTWDGLIHKADVGGEGEDEASDETPEEAGEDGDEVVSDEADAIDPEVIAEILYGIYGEDALEMVRAMQEGEGQEDEEPQTEGAKALWEWATKAWNAADHPRGKGGRFIPKGSSEAVSAAKETISGVIKGGSKATPKEVMDHLSILTVKQIRELGQQHGKKIPKMLREDLIDAVRQLIGGSETAAPEKPGTTQEVSEVTQETPDKQPTSPVAYERATGGEIYLPGKHGAYAGLFSGPDSLKRTAQHFGLPDDFYEDHRQTHATSNGAEIGGYIAINPKYDPDNAVLNAVENRKTAMERGLYEGSRKKYYDGLVKDAASKVVAAARSQEAPPATPEEATPAAEEAPQPATGTMSREDKIAITKQAIEEWNQKPIHEKLPVHPPQIDEALTKIHQIETGKLRISGNNPKKAVADLKAMVDAWKQQEQDKSKKEFVRSKFTDLYDKAVDAAVESAAGEIADKRNPTRETYKQLEELSKGIHANFGEVLNLSPLDVETALREKLRDMSMAESESGPVGTSPSVRRAERKFQNVLSADKEQEAPQPATGAGGKEPKNGDKNDEGEIYHNGAWVTPLNPGQRMIKTPTAKKKPQSEEAKAKAEARKRVDNEDKAMRQVASTPAGNAFLQAELHNAHGGKMPHQMTLKDIAKKNGTTPKELLAAEDGRSFELLRDHKRSVSGALQHGLSVPAEVLEDYPDLAAKYGGESPSPSPAGKEDVDSHPVTLGGKKIIANFNKDGSERKERIGNVTVITTNRDGVKQVTLEDHDAPAGSKVHSAFIRGENSAPKEQEVSKQAPSLTDEAKQEFAKNHAKKVNAELKKILREADMSGSPMPYKQAMEKAKQRVLASYGNKPSPSPAGKPGGAAGEAPATGGEGKNTAPKETPARAEPPASKPAAAASESDLWDAARRGHQKQLREFRQTGVLPKIWDLVDKIQEEHPDATKEQIHKLLQKWQGEDKVTLQVVNDPHFEPRSSEGIPSNRGILGYMDFKDDVMRDIPPPKKRN